MLRYTNIMVPYDGSDHAKNALSHAIDLAKECKAKLYIANVCNMVSVISNYDQISIAESQMTAELAEELEKQARQNLKEAMESVPEGIEAEELFEVGSPGPVLLSFAAKYHCDLIVMGSRGLGTLKGIFMGSVSSYIVGRAKCAVLVVK